MEHSQKIKEIIQKMQHLGLETNHLDDIQSELQALEKPWLAKITHSVQKHFQFVQGEIRETKEMASLLRKGMNNLTEDEKETVKRQLLDFAKIVPAGLIAATNAILPIPGTSIFTPMLLQKAGLLPTQWNEAYLLELLQKEESRLRSQGLLELAGQLHTISTDIHTHTNNKAVHLDVLLHWDANNNGVWDPEEIEAYQQECKRVQDLARSKTHAQAWYVCQHGLVFGPITFAKLPKHDEDLLVRYEYKTKWVALVDLTDVEHLRSDISPTPVE